MVALSTIRRITPNSLFTFTITKTVQPTEAAHNSTKMLYSWLLQQRLRYYVENLWVFFQCTVDNSYTFFLIFTLIRTSYNA